MEEYRKARRGYSDSDASDFSSNAIEVLERAGEEVSYLIDRNYPRDTTISFVGDRYQLTARQRLLLARAVSGENARHLRKSKMHDLNEIAGRTILIDGFNTVVTLEVALSGSPVVIGQDGTARDLAGLRGTYKIIDKTPKAIGLLLDSLESHDAAGAMFLFDQPVSNSGRLCQLVRELGSKRKLKVEAEALYDVDSALSKSENIVTSDSIVLDSCKSWFNLGAQLIEDLVAEGYDPIWVIDIFEMLGTWNRIPKANSDSGNAHRC
ncbi:MAG: DUF434 domain-containing protein [Coriobacteriales bacterium]|jgi:hypothetical protein